MTVAGILGNLGVGVYIKGGSSVGRSPLATKFLIHFLAQTFPYVRGVVDPAMMKGYEQVTKKTSCIIIYQT